MAALLWALEGWFAPPWALFGMLLALPLCAFSYWMNSYMGGSAAAIGGALVVGAYARLIRRRRETARHGFWLPVSFYFSSPGPMKGC